MIETLSRWWTNSIAYVALLIGAGLSIAGNVADTFRTRQTLTDVLDIVIAVAYPALVVLMVELFVNKRWVGLRWPMQVIRWTGTLVIGGIAMRVSWVHLNDLMLSRGQTADVAILGPLAIDLLAIMATALILAGRRRTGQDRPKRDSPEWTTPAAVLDSIEQDRTLPRVQDSSPAGQDNPPPRLIDWAARLDRTQDTLPQRVRQDTDKLNELSVADEAEAFLRDSAPAPAIPRKARTSRLTKAQTWEIRFLTAAAVDAGVLPVTERRELLAGAYGVSAKTIQRIEGR